MPSYQKYTELDVWEQARELVSLVYELTASYPKSEQFGIISQIRRCVVSVLTNIAEGCWEAAYIRKNGFFVNSPGLII